MICTSVCRNVGGAVAETETGLQLQIRKGIIVCFQWPTRLEVPDWGQHPWLVDAVVHEWGGRRIVIAVRTACVHVCEQSA